MTNKTHNNGTVRERAHLNVNRKAYEEGYDAIFKKEKNMRSKNFLEETLLNLAANGKLPSDVLWVGDKENFCSWEEFSISANFEYDRGYGADFIDRNLKIVGDSWWMERHEYDGSEWWEFKTLPIRPREYKKPPQHEYKWDTRYWLFGVKND